jgi:hypothetical protein
MLFQPGEIEEFWLPFCFCGFGFAFCWLSVGFLGKNRSFLEQEAERIRQLNALSTRWDRGFLVCRFTLCLGNSQAEHRIHLAEGGPPEQAHGRHEASRRAPPGECSPNVP